MNTQLKRLAQIRLQMKQTEDVPESVKNEIQSLINAGYYPEGIEEKILQLFEERKNLEAFNVFYDEKERLEPYILKRLLKAISRKLALRIDTLTENGALDTQIDCDFESLRQLGLLSPSRVPTWVLHLDLTQRKDKADFLARLSSKIFPGAQLLSGRDPNEILPTRLNRRKETGLRRILRNEHFVYGRFAEAIKLQLDIIDDNPGSANEARQINLLCENIEAQALEVLSEHLLSETSKYGLLPSAEKANDPEIESLTKISKMLRERHSRPMILVAFDILKNDDATLALDSAEAILRLTPYNVDSQQLAMSAATRFAKLASMRQCATARDNYFQRALRLIAKVESFENDLPSDLET
ncbi:MAG: hypothetical protein J0L82_10395 [Deltaproteobacteria bacterium]|jgi:hypothetical protein|nr:hypothetical protein [Deltaproteobacteria bacterium]